MNVKRLGGGVLVATGAILLLREAPPRDLSCPVGAPSISAGATKSHVRKPELDPSLFEGLPAHLIPVVRKLEQAAKRFEDSRPEHEGWRSRHWAWFRFAEKQLSSLPDEIIADLAAEYLGEGSGWSMSTLYGQPLFCEWGRRDAPTAEVELIRQARASGQLHNPPGLEGSNVRLEEISDLLHFVFKGHAEIDPRDAWSRYQDLAEDPELKRLACETVTPTAIARSWAARDPEGAWDLVFDSDDDWQFTQLLQGFAFGAPEGQDWRALVEAVEAHANAESFELITLASRALMVRWLTENPGDALETYARLARDKGVVPYHVRDPRDNPFAAIDPGKYRAKVTARDYQLDLFEALDSAFDPISEQLPRTLETLREDGHPELAFALMQDLLSDSFPPPDRTLIDLIPRWRDPAEARQLLLVAARHTKARTPFFDSSATNPGIDMLRTAASDMSLDPQTKAALEAEFTRVVEDERKDPPHQAADPFR